MMEAEAKGEEEEEEEANQFRPVQAAMNRLKRWKGH